jgi:two-component sensor histidine kinase
VRRPAPHERMLATLIAIGEVASLVATLFALAGQPTATPSWWDASVVTAAAAGCAFTTLGARGLVPLQWGPAVYFGTATAAVLTLPLLSELHYAGTLRPWVEPLLPVAVAGAALMSTSRWRAVVAALAATSMHAAVHLLEGWHDELPTVAFDAVYNFTLFLMVLAVLLAMDAARQRLESTEREAVGSYVRARATEQLSRRHTRWDALVHDEVLVALERLAREDAGEEARRAASAVAALLLAGPGEEPVSPVRLREELLQAVLSICPFAETRFDADPGAPVPVPDEVAEALLSAATEALRNAATHAYPGAAGPVSVELRHGAEDVRVVVADRGRGFRRHRVPASSFGVALSVENRMDAVGGSARIDTAPGEGTRVTLSWRPTTEVPA